MRHAARAQAEVAELRVTVARQKEALHGAARFGKASEPLRCAMARTRATHTRYTQAHRTHTHTHTHTRTHIHTHHEMQCGSWGQEMQQITLADEGERQVLRDRLEQCVRASPRLTFRAARLCLLAEVRARVQLVCGTRCPFGPSVGGGAPCDRRLQGGKRAGFAAGARSDAAQFGRRFCRR
jgi:hypothetical protein